MAKLLLYIQNQDSLMEKIKSDKKNENSGLYNIKYIQLFTKSTNLCGTVEIYLKTNYPLTILYNVANLGDIKLCLSPNVQ